MISTTDGIVKLRLLGAGDRTFEIVPCSGMDIRTIGKSVVSTVAAGAALVACGIADDVRAQDAKSGNEVQSVTIFSEVEVTKGGTTQNIGRAARRRFLTVNSSAAEVV